MKVLVVGGGGMLGHRCFLEFRKRWGAENVAVTLRKSRGSYSKLNIFEQGPIFDNIDVLNFKELESVLNQFRPDLIVNCVGLTLRKSDLQDFLKALDVNSMLPHKLAIWAQAHSAKVVHFSTDCVFDGKKGSEYFESEIPSGEDVYAKSKFLGEISYSHCLTMRLSIVGREIDGKTELIEWFMSQKGKTVKGFSKVYYSGLTTNFVAKEVIKWAESGFKVSGLYQISSQPISKFELLKLVKEVYGLDIEIQEFSEYESNKVLNCERYQRATGFVSPSWAAMIKDMFESENGLYD